jgi:hypothetical protein
VQNLTLDFAGVINKVYLVVSCWYQKVPTDILLSAIFNMTSGIVSEVVVERLVQALKSHPCQASEDVVTWSTQSEEYGESIVGSILNIMFHTFIGMFTGFDKNSVDGFTLSLKRISAVAVAIRSVTSIFGVLMVMLEFCFDHIAKFFKRYFDISPSGYAPQDLNELYSIVDEMEKNETITKSKISIHAARQVINFRNKLSTFLKLANASKVNKLVMMHLNYLKRQAEKWYEDIPPYLRDIPGSDRARPVWIYIYGKPRIGKTSVVAKSLVFRCAAKMGLIAGVEKWDAFVFNRNLGEPYWEGYNGQPVVSYTDILQEIKDEAKLDLAITELTRVNDSNAYCLPMAFDGPKGKGKNFFSSSLLVSDAQGDLNISPFMDRCWSAGKHIFARRTIVLELVLNAKYESDIGFNKSLVNEEYIKGNYIYTKEDLVAPRDMYIFRLRDTLNHNQVLREFTDYSEAIEYISDVCANTYHREVVQSDSVEKYCKYLYKPNSEEFYDADNCKCYDAQELSVLADICGYNFQHDKCFGSQEEFYNFFDAKVYYVVKKN